MQSVASGLIPIAAAIALGWLLRRSELVRSDLWAGVNKLGYVALLPALLFVTIAEADFEGLPTGRFITAAVLGFIGMASIALLLRLVIKVDGPSYSSVFQGAIRWNGFVVLALAQTGMTAEQAALVALVFAPTVPLINVLCVAALSVWGDNDQDIKLSRVARRIVTNPLILGCVAGAAARLTPALQPPVLIETAELIGRAALPLILLTVGAGLNFSAINERPRLLTLAIVLKLIIAPLLFIGLGHALGAPREVIMVLAAIGSAPGAASSYVLAKELGGNAELTAGHVTATTILGFISIPLWLAAAGS